MRLSRRRLFFSWRILQNPNRLNDHGLWLEPHSHVDAHISVSGILSCCDVGCANSCTLPDVFVSGCACNVWSYSQRTNQSQRVQIAANLATNVLANVISNVGSSKIINLSVSLRHYIKTFKSIETLDNTKKPHNESSLQHCKIPYQIPYTEQYAMTPILSCSVLFCPVLFCGESVLSYPILIYPNNLCCGEVVHVHACCPYVGNQAWMREKRNTAIFFC